MIVPPESVVGGLDCARQPSWSTDGKWVYYSAALNGSSQVFRVPVAGGIPQQITRSGGCRPQESPDASSVYYTLQGSLWRMGLNGGAPEKVVSSHHFERSKLFSYLVREHGVFLLPLFAKTWTLEYYRLPAGAVARIASGDKRTSRGLAVSRDASRILFPLTDQTHMNLMLVRNPD